ncbi:hypothetical protein J6G99_07420 [bacterium]|nr:hypothetical protein [bacterium]
MNNEKLKLYLVPILITTLAFVILVIAGQKVFKGIENIVDNNSKIETKTGQLQEKQEKLAKFKKAAAEQAKKEAENQKVEKPFYKAIDSGMDTEAVIAGEFSEILELIRANKIKVRSIKYDYNPQDDNFVKGAGTKYNAARLNMEMIGSYSDYDSFLRELYKHEHFLDIQSVEIVPYRKNKKILLINFKLKLYSKK